MEYVIERSDQYAVISGGEVQWTRSHRFASIFKVRERAEKIAAKAGGVVQPYYGGIIHSTKSTVMPPQSKINRRSAYRSI